MEKENKGHVVVVPYPAQGHITPLHQFSKRLVSKGIKSTLTLTVFHSKSINPDPSGLVAFDTISDGYDDGGFTQAESIHAYHQSLQSVGSRTLAQVIRKHQGSDNPVTCVVYDSFSPWVLDVARECGVAAASFFTQACAVNYLYCLVYHGKLQIPVSSESVSVDGLPFLEPQDMPSFLSDTGSYPAFRELLVDQFSNVDKADFVLVNIFQDLEVQEVELMSRVCPLMTVGPTVPSKYLDQRIKKDNSYDLALFDNRDASYCSDWLNAKPEGSVVYVAFGSFSELSRKQMEELAWALTNFSFLWVVRASEEAKLPADFLQTIDREKGLVVKWSRQLDVLSNKAVGCFVTHCGWNSTMEALSLGVPLVGMPQWTDQPTNAKYIQDVWKVGVRVKTDKESGINKREEIEFCIKDVMQGEKAKEVKQNAKKWRDLAIEAVEEGGTSDLNIDAFVSKIESLKLQMNNHEIKSD